MLQRYGLLLAVLFLTSCVAAREDPTAPPLPAPPTAAVTPGAVPSSPTPAKTLVPKRDDLLLIEFFAGT